jgi:hypothetical protein
MRAAFIATLAAFSLLLPVAQAVTPPAKKADIFGVWLGIASNSNNFDPQWANKPYAPANRLIRLLPSEASSRRRYCRATIRSCC